MEGVGVLVGGTSCACAVGFVIVYTCGYFAFPCLGGAGGSVRCHNNRCGEILSPTQYFVPYEYIPTPPPISLLVLLKCCPGMVFAVLGEFWSLVFSWCSSYFSTLMQMPAVFYRSLWFFNAIFFDMSRLLFDPAVCRGQPLRHSRDIDFQIPTWSW